MINEVQDNICSIIEVWSGVFYYIDGLNNLSPQEWNDTRNKIINDYISQENLNELANTIGAALPGAGPKIECVTPSSDNGDPVRDENNVETKYIRYPLLRVGDLLCGIRLNVCTSPNLSKIFVYFITDHSSGGYSLNDISGLKTRIDELTSKIYNHVLAIYKPLIKTQTNCELEKTPYEFKVIDFGSHAMPFKKFAEASETSTLQKLIENSPEIKRGYALMMLLAADKFSNDCITFDCLIKKARENVVRLDFVAVPPEDDREGFSGLFVKTKTLKRDDNFFYAGFSYLPDDAKDNMCDKLSYRGLTDIQYRLHIADKYLAAPFSRL